METRQRLTFDSAAPARSGSAPRSRAGQSVGAARRLGPSTIGLAQVAAASLIGAGWLLRDERFVVPERGAGYLLGLLGLGAMVLLLAYPVRKRVRALRNLGRVGRWFEIHMLLGLVGPVAVLYHSNFSLGSTNANVALLCVLVVAGSGVVGRVLYVRIHVGLEGRRRTLAEVREAVLSSHALLETSAASEQVVARLAAYEDRVLGSSPGEAPTIVRRLGAGWSGRRALHDVRRLLKRSGAGPAPTAASERSVLNAARRYVGAVRSVAGFQSWERLFALWHVAHLPLSFLLFASAAVHVIAVHLY